MEIRDIQGYESLYAVSDDGRVWSKIRQKWLKVADNGKGYLKVILCKNGERKPCFVHRLVAQAFIENPDNLPEVNHKNEVKTYNRVDNLEWCTSKYNINYRKSQSKSY